MAAERPVARPISSRRNPLVRAARSLARPAARAAEHRFLVEGPRVLQAALRASALETLLGTTAGLAGNPDLVLLAEATRCRLVPVTPAVLEAVAQTNAPQGLVGIAREVVRRGADLPGDPRLVCVLVDVRDPGNLGTVLRAADAAGADAVAVTAGSVDPQQPKAVRASAGSLFHLPVVGRVGWPALREACRSAGLRLIGADAHAAKTTDDAPLDAPCAIVFGNEAHGLPGAVRGDLDLVVRVPLAGRAESLNLAAAAAVMLFESARRIREAPAPDA